MEQTYAGDGGLTDVNDASSVLAWWFAAADGTGMDFDRTQRAR